MEGKRRPGIEARRDRLEQGDGAAARPPVDVTAAAAGLDAEQPADLSERELDVLKLVATGATNQQIARSLIISPNTVKVHLRNIFEKLGVQSRTEATMAAVRRGLVTVSGMPLSEPAGVTLVPVTPGETEPVPAPFVRLPIARWQRVYMLCAAVLVLAAVLAPGWSNGRSSAQGVSAFSDVGSPSMAPAPRPQTLRWEARAAMPEGRSRFALISAEDRLYAIGGETAAGVSDQVSVFSPTSNGWLPAAAKPAAASNIVASLIQGRIYVPGGTSSSGSALRTLDIYDPGTDTWAAGAPMPAPRAAYALAVVDDKLYLFGGWDGTLYRDETFVYDPAADLWSTATAMPAATGFMAAAAQDGLIYVVGGHDGARVLDSVWAYDPAQEGAGEPWSARASLSAARAGLGLNALHGRLYAIGGGWDAPLAFNEQFDVKTGAWSRIESPVDGQWRNLALATYADRLYAVGGWSGGYLTTNEQYTALYILRLPLGSAGTK